MGLIIAAAVVIGALAYFGVIDLSGIAESASGSASESTAAPPPPKPPAKPPAPHAPPPDGVDPAVARTICNVAADLGANAKVRLSAFEAALVESGVRNLDYGDRDSLGVFQQRPSMGWGTPDQVRDPTYAARQYIGRAINADRGNPNLSPGYLAQSVQRSGFPDRYDTREGQARALIAQFCT